MNVELKSTLNLKNLNKLKILISNDSKTCLNLNFVTFKLLISKSRGGISNNDTE